MTYKINLELMKKGLEELAKYRLNSIEEVKKSEERYKEIPKSVVKYFDIKKVAEEFGIETSSFESKYNELLKLQ